MTDQQSDRTLDALVAEKIMGWKCHHDYHDSLERFPEGTECGIFHGKDGAVRFVHHFIPGGTDTYWHPTSDPRADYEVLCRVRTWKASRVRKVRETLKAIWDKRADFAYERGEKRVVWGCVQYQPGDYSRAAAAVREEGT